MSAQIRTLDRAGVAQLLAWAGDEGWNPGLADAGPFLAADPNGFFGAFVDETLVAGISAVAYDDNFGFIGLYICHPDHRGKGYGSAVWDHAMAYLGDRTIGLDGVQAQQENYRRMGFVQAYETVRMSGTLPHIRTSPLVGPVADVADILALDRECFPAARQQFLRHWIAAPHHAAITKGGYVVARRCRKGTKIGPLFAADCDTANALLTGFHGPVQIDIPASQTLAIEHVIDLGFVPGFRTSRMYRGKAPDLAMEKVFAVTSLELG